jgi:hypothetical protein
MIAQEKPIGPTREQIAKGGYEKPEGRGSTAIFTNLNATYLDRLLNARAITRRQHAAGNAFMRTYLIAWGNMSTSADSTVLRIGGVSYETEGEALRWAHARARLHTVLNRVGPAVYDLLREVCVRETPLGRDRGRASHRYEMLRLGCNQCAIVYGIDKEAA